MKRLAVRGGPLSWGMAMLRAGLLVLPMEGDVRQNSGQGAAETPADQLCKGDAIEMYGGVASQSAERDPPLPSKRWWRGQVGLGGQGVSKT